MLIFLSLKTYNYSLNPVFSNKKLQLIYSLYLHLAGENSEAFSNLKKQISPLEELVETKPELNCEH